MTISHFRKLCCSHMLFPYKTTCTDNIVKIVMICFLSLVLVSQKPDLDYINFTWNKMTASEFEEHCRVKKLTKKADFIHLIQVGVAHTQCLWPVDWVF